MNHSDYFDSFLSDIEQEMAKDRLWERLSHTERILAMKWWFPHRSTRSQKRRYRRVLLEHFKSI